MSPPVPAAALAGLMASSVLYAWEQPPAAQRLWVRIPAQTFQMGCVPQDRECSTNEAPRHAVRITRGFWLMATEVTVAALREYAAATGAPFPTQPEWSASDHPAVNVTWTDAARFCESLGGRLPTEAEWEAAARGGKEADIYPWGDRYERGLVNDSDDFRHAATTPVGQYPPNAYGLYDIIGNVWEWVHDWFAADYYAHSPAQDPTGPATGDTRVTRGGSWRPYPRVFRLSNRGRSRPDRANYYIGFRCARSAPPPAGIASNAHRGRP